MATKKRAAKPTATGQPSEGAVARVEHRIEKAVKDAVAEVENRLMIAGEAADESTSSEVNILSALEVAIHPPSADVKTKRKKRS